MATCGSSCSQDKDPEPSCITLPAGGYDCDFVDSPPQSLECPVCLLVLKEPHLLSCCGVKICHTCVSGIQQTKGACPKCRKEMYVTLLEKELERSILGLQVKCSLGCPWVGELRQLERHVSPSNEGDCPLVNVSCRHGCGQIMKRADEKEHEEETCTQRPIELQLVTIQCHVKRMFTEMKKTFETEMKVMIANEMEKMKKEIVKLKEENVQFATTIPDQFSIKGNKPDSTIVCPVCLNSRATVPVEYPPSSSSSISNLSSDVLLLMPKLKTIRGVDYYPQEGRIEVTASDPEERSKVISNFQESYQNFVGNPRQLKTGTLDLPSSCMPQEIAKVVDQFNEKYHHSFFSYNPTCHSVKIISLSRQFEQAKLRLKDAAGQPPSSNPSPPHEQAKKLLKKVAEN